MTSVVNIYNPPLAQQPPPVQQPTPILADPFYGQCMQNKIILLLHFVV